MSTFSGSTPGFNNGTSTTAQFNWPMGVAIDATGTVFVADEINNVIRKITPTGLVSTFAGSGVFGFADGIANVAQFNGVIGLTVDSAGNVFVADTNNHCIRKITSAGVVSTLAGSSQGYANGIGNATQFDYPSSVALDSAGNVYVADTNNNCIRKITASGVVSTLAGSIAGYADGIGSVAQFNRPRGIAIDADGILYVADSFNNRIRKVSTAGLVSTFAGSTMGYADGNGTAAQFNYPYGITVDSVGNIYVTDASNHRIRKITVTGTVSTLAGSGVFGFADGTGIVAQFANPCGIAVNLVGDLFIADATNHRIRIITDVLSTKDYYQNQVSIYPNPTSSIINIESTNILVIKVIIFDINGRTLQYENIIN